MWSFKQHPLSLPRPQVLSTSKCTLVANLSLIPQHAQPGQLSHICFLEKASSKQSKWVIDNIRIVLSWLPSLASPSFTSPSSHLLLHQLHFPTWKRRNDSFIHWVKVYWSPVMTRNCTGYQRFKDELMSAFLKYVFSCLAAPDLRCGKQDLPSLLEHEESFSSQQANF